MNGVIQVRPYTASDRSAVLACIIELQETERTLDPRLPTGAAMAATYLEELLGFAEQWAGELLVAAGPHVVGFASMFARVPFETADDPAGTYALIGDLVVLPEARQAGIARQLLAAAEASARRAGATELRLELLAGNASADRLYLAAGFAPYLLTQRKLLRAAAP
jgi:ribosomal protein S18 acetylase RimI-like enzyme